MGDINFFFLQVALIEELRKLEARVSPSMRALWSYANRFAIFAYDDTYRLQMLHVEDRDQVIQYLTEKGIKCGRLFYTGVWFFTNKNDMEALRREGYA